MSVEIFDGCDVCGDDHETENCPELGFGDSAPSQNLSRARLTLPHFVEVRNDESDQIKVVATQTIAAKTRLGPYEARKTTQNIVSDDGFVLKIIIKDGTSVSLDTTDENECNWLCLVQTASTTTDQNCMAIQIGTELFYSTTKEILPEEELKVWYAPHYARKLGKAPQPDGKTKVLLGLYLAQEVTGPPAVDVSSYSAELEDTPDQEPDNHSPVKSGVSNNLKTTTQKRRARDKEYKCPECHIAFPTQYILDQHRVIHKTAVKIEKLSEKPNDPSMNVQDEEADQGGDEIFTKISPYTAAALNTLTDPRQLHVKYKHSQDGSKKCLRCNQEFGDLQSLAKHVQHHILQSEKEKRLSDPDIPQPRKRGRPRGSTKRKYFTVQEDDKDDDYIRQPSKQSRIVHTYGKFKQPGVEEEGTSGNVRKSSRIRAGIESGKINLATRTKQEEADEEEEEGEIVMISPKPKQVVNIPTSGTRRRGRPRKYPLQSSQVITIDGDSNDTASLPAKQSSPAKQQTPAKPSVVAKPSLETLLKSPLSAVTNHGLVATPTAVSSPIVKPVKTQDGVVTQSDPQSGEVTLSLPDNVTSNEYVTSLINLDDIDIMQKDASEVAQKTSSPSKEANSKESSDVCVKENPSDANQTKESTDPGEEGDQQGEAGDGEETEVGEEEVEDSDGEREEGEVVFASAGGQYNCSACGEFIGDESSLSSHRCKKMKQEDRSDPNDALGIYTCVVCNKAFDRENYLKKHMEGHEEESTCPDCGKIFIRKESLKTHVCQAKVKTEDLEKKHFCEFCGAAFSNEKYLVRHMASHTGEFRCSKCNRTFTRKESLLFHMKKCNPEGLKEDELGFPCSLCHRVFSREVSLQNHMAVHNEEHKCNACDKSFSSAIRLKNHDCVAQKVSPDGEAFTCTHEGCGKTFAKELYLTRHMIIHTGQFSCVICSKRYGRKEELIKHMLECTATVQVETTGEIVCTVCNKKFDDASSFRTHFMEHTHPYKCNDCGKMFLRKTNFEAHASKCVPWDGEPVSCKKCGKRFRTPLFLQRHSIVHEDPKYKCDSCGKKFHRVDYYNDHMCIDPDGNKMRIVRTRHKSEFAEKAQHICPTCGKSYVSVSNLNKHMLTHGEKNEICEVCHKRFHLKVSLKEHMKMVHTDKYNYQCKYCGKRMKCRNSMYGHIAQFHASTRYLYQCPTCGKKFRQKGNMKKHELTHSDKRTFSCKFCPKTFKFPEQIRRHELLHTHGHRFKCDMCDKTFVMEFEKRRHMQTYHGGIVYVCKYCLTDCHHFSTMKRHLQRRHYDMTEWQTDTNKFIQTLIKSDESEEYHKMKRQREEQVGMFLDQPPHGQIEIQGITGEGTQALVDASTGQIQIITRPVQGILGDAGSVVVEENQQLMAAGENVQVITADHPSLVGTELGALVDAVPEDQIVQPTAEEVLPADVAGEENTVVLVTEQGLNNMQEGLVDEVGTPITDQEALNIPGLNLGDGQGPFIVAEVQGLNAPGQNQTFIIHGSLDNMDPESFMTKEIAEALQNLSNSGALGNEQQKIIQIGDVIGQEEIAPSQTMFITSEEDPNVQQPPASQ